MKTHDYPVVTKKSRRAAMKAEVRRQQQKLSDLQAQLNRETQAEYAAKAVLKRMRAEEAGKPPVHPYEVEREGKTPLGFADYILTKEGRIEIIKGHEFIDSKAATPWLKVRAANQVLKLLGLPQITNNNAWRV